MTDLIAAIRKTFTGDPVVVVDGESWVRLPNCDGCKSYRWDKEHRRFFHDRDCSLGQSSGR